MSGIADAPSPWWHTGRHRDRRPFLHARAKALSAVRGWFAAEGFIEADVGAIAASPGAETHVHAFAIEGGYLHTSPEFAMKKLLAAGERNIFFLGKVYRAGDHGPLHAPEFTMLEWYRAGEEYEAVQRDCVAIVRAVSGALGVAALTWQGRRCDPFADCKTMAVREVVAEELTHDAFSRRIVQIEPSLGHPHLTVLKEYPLPEAALARVSPSNSSVAERFELYACGVELANGFGELTDPVEQRARLEAAMAEKQRLYGETWPIDEGFLAALAHMPAASGCALGVDRLVLLAAGGVHIDQVLWTPLGSRK